MGGTGEEAFEQCGQRLLLGGFSNDVEQCASNEREIGQEVGVTGTGSVLAHQRITPPMVADFDAPVAGLDVGKKGVLGNASSPWACLSSLGWLPLTWSR